MYYIYSLTAKELEYIPKIILLREFKNYIDQLWDRLPELKAYKGSATFGSWNIIICPVIDRILMIQLDL